MRYSRTSERRAVILMVVLSLLTLFALVGITFVLYADAEATAARVAREAQSFQVSDMKPEEAMSYFLGQFIYDVPDTMAGIGSGIRGHSLARSMYGYFYVSGTATYNNPTILSTATGNLGTGAFVMVQSNASGAVLPAYIANVVTNTSITLSTPWPYGTGAVTINVDTNTFAYNGIGRLHYGNLSGVGYPPPNFTPGVITPLTNVPNNYTGAPGDPLDDYVLVNYTWFAGDPAIRDPERFGSRLSAGVQQTNGYVGGNSPYTYPDLNSFFLAAVRADGTVLTPSFHRPWLFQVGTINAGGVPTPKSFDFNDITNQNWWNKQGRYLTLRPRPAEHPQFPLPGDKTGDVKNLPWAPGGNDSIWVDIGAPVMTAPDGTKYKMLYAPLIVDLDGRINLNTAGNLTNYIAAMSANSYTASPNGPTSWQIAAGAHVSNQGWGPWEVNLSKVLWGDQGVYPTLASPIPQSTPPTPPEWMRLLTGASLATTTAPNLSPWIYQPGVVPPVPLVTGLSAWLLPGVRGRYVESTIPPAPLATLAPPVYSLAGLPLFPPPNPPTTNTPQVTPNAPGLVYAPGTGIAGGLGLSGTYPHIYAQVDSNGLNENPLSSVTGGRPGLLGPNVTTGLSSTNPFATFTGGYYNGGTLNVPVFVPPLPTENSNHPGLYNVFQSPVTSGFVSNLFSRAFTASDQAFLLQPNASQQGPVDANAAAIDSDLMRLCPNNFPSASVLANLPAGIKALALRYRNMVTTQSWDIGQPGVTPYWWNGGPTMTSTDVTRAPYGSAVTFPIQSLMLPPSPGITNVPNNNLLTSEFSPGWRSLSANTLTYLPFLTGNPTSYANPVWLWGNPTANQWNFKAGTANTLGYLTPGARIRLNRPLPPYPHMGAGLTPPYNSQTTGIPPGYGYAYDLRNPGVANQYQAALNARQALANEIYRRLLLVAGLTPIPFGAGLGQTANPNSTQLAPRRWLAQLAVNIVDYIDEDDMSTPFNFYTIADGLPAASLSSTTGGDDTTAAIGTNLYGTKETGANPVYWVFGTELPKVVLNEVLAEAKSPNPSSAAGGTESVKVWAELYNTMPATSASNTQPQDINRVPLYMTFPAGGGGYSPYRITIAQNLQTSPLPPGETSNSTYNTLPDASANVLGQAYFGNANSPSTVSPLPQSTTDSDFQAGNPGASTIPLIQGGTQGAGTGTNNAGVDAGSYFLIGPPSGSSYPDPFVLAAGTPPNGVPKGTPTLRTSNMQYQPTTTSWPPSPTNPDERTNGLTVMLRRLANPYLPFNPNPSTTDPSTLLPVPNPVYNPYVTVDYVPSVPIFPSNTNPILSSSKRQPYAGLLQPSSPPTVTAYPGGTFGYAIDSNSPVYVTSETQPVGIVSTANTVGGFNVYNTFGIKTGNNPQPQSTHYDWLVHLDRPPISPTELLHVSALPPYKLTQQFMLGDDTKPDYRFGHYAPWSDSPPLGIVSVNGTATTGSQIITNVTPNTTGLTVGAPVTVISNTNGTRFSSTINFVTPTSITLATPWVYGSGAVTVSNLYYTMPCPWWFDPTLPAGSSHRLYRLFEFLECGDRAFGVNGLGRIPGKVNLNTVWDPEILHALIDANQTMGAATTLPSATPPLAYDPVNLTTGLPLSVTATADLVTQIFANMMSSRSPNYYNSGAYSSANRPLIGPVNMGTFLVNSSNGATLLPPPGPGNVWIDDRPFMPLSMGQYLPPTTGTVVGASLAAAGQFPALQFPNGLSVTQDTILRTNNPLLNAFTAPPTPPANNLYQLFQNYYDNGSATSGAPVTSAVHPYLQTQLLNKLYNNVTTRSNTFAVFLTVGFFQVMTDPTTGNILPALGQPPNPPPGTPFVPQLGPELGRTEGKQVRHRMFAIVDRTNLATLLTTGQAIPLGTGISGPISLPLNMTGSQAVQIPSPAAPNLTVTGTLLPTPQLFVLNPITGAPGVIQAGTQLVIEPGTVLEETVTVTSVTPPTVPGGPASFSANFTLPHGAGGTPFTIIQRGNPGPWLIPYDPRLDSYVVPYFSIID